MFNGHVYANSFDDDVTSLVGENAAEAKLASERLRKSGSLAIPALINGLDGGDRKTKIMLLDALVEIKQENKKFKARDEDVASLAQRARQEKDRTVRFRMINAVREVGATSAIAELERFASEDSEEKIRAEATHYVASVSGKDIQFFRKQFKDPSKLVRHYAAFELARLGDASGRDLSLRTLRESAVSDERRLAIATLGEIGTTDDVGLLKQLSQSAMENYGARVMASHAVMTIGLRQLSERDRLSFLIKSLDDSDAMVRDWAYTRLWNLQDPTTSARLKTYLAEPGHKGYKEATDALSLR